MFLDHANSYRFISPLFLLPASLPVCRNSCDGEKVSAAGSSNRGVSPCLAGAMFSPKPIGTCAGISLGVAVA
jgi:hypothetical protein